MHVTLVIRFTDLSGRPLPNTCMVLVVCSVHYHHHHAYVNYVLGIKV
jgi:hypothetical protein